MKISEAWAIFRNISNDGTPDLEKGRAIQIVMDAATHNSITKNDMLRVIRWLWNMVFEEATGSDGENAPTADVAPVVHGHWFLTEPEYLDCSVCGKSYYTGIETWSAAQDHLEYAGGYKFCPNCGARMDGATDG